MVSTIAVPTRQRDVIKRRREQKEVSAKAKELDIEQLINIYVRRIEKSEGPSTSGDASREGHFATFSAVWEGLRFQVPNRRYFKYL